MLYSAPSFACRAIDPSICPSPSPLEALEPRLLFTAVPLITEFLASNDAGLVDEDGESSDWIELHNAGDTALDLTGWHLTDDSSDLTQWVFPAESLAPGEYLVVFASNKDRDVAGSELHTNFKLSASGEYLALVQQDGTTVAFEYAPEYPAQSTDVAYGLVAPEQGAAAGFLTTPTPGTSNVIAGPIIESVTQDPPQPTATQDLLIEASVAANAGIGISHVDLHYRVGFGAEGVVDMFDDGTNGDTTSGDGIYTGTISSGLYAAGDMVRWYVTAEDTGGTVSRAPTFIDQSGGNQSAEYFGTVVAESIATALPTFQWFTQDESASHNRTGTRASVFYNGRFYDNIFVRQRGGFTNQSLSQKFDFNKGEKLYISEELGSVDEINLNGNGADGSFLRQPMGFGAYAEAGNASSASFLTYMALNGAFDRVGVWIEQVDEDYVDRHGYDADGDLYKFVQRSNLNPGVSDTSTGIEKKTNDKSDLSSAQDLVDGLNLPSESQRQDYIRDNLDIAQMINYLAARTLIQGADDVRKNFYLYVDNTPDGDNLWRILPWDLDFTFNIVGGHDNQDSERTEHPFFGVEEFPTADGANQWSMLYDRLLETEEIQGMYLRRVRTLMDDLYNGASGATTWFANFVNTNFPDIDPHLGSSATNGKNGLLSDIEDRRDELYNTYTANIPGYSVVIPGAQSASPSLTIGAIEFAPVGGQDREYIQLTNPNAFALDISGWTVEGGITHTFRPGTVIAAGSSLYITPSVSAFRDRPTGPSGGQQLFTQQWDDGHLSSFGETITVKRADGSTADTETYTGAPTPEQDHLRITELHYNPTGPSAAEQGAGFTDGDQFEFIELFNTSATETLDLAGVSFSNGIGGAFAGAQQTVLDVGFDAGTDGFAFVINPFNGTSQTGVAGGTQEAGGGNGGGGALRVDLFSSDGSPTHGASSAAFTHTFNLAQAGEVTLTFDYRFFYGAGFESNEVGQAIVELDGARLGGDANGSLASYTGNGNGGSPTDTGWQSFSVTLNLEAGNHTLDLGAYYSRSTFTEENVTAWYDNVSVTAPGAPLPLAPGERALLVSDLAAFTERYGQAVVDNAAYVVQYSGNLDNGGERLKLNDANGSTILDFRYEDGDDPGEEAWPTTPDGDGPSLVVVDTDGDYGAGNNWTASTTPNGTPGSDEAAGFVGDINGDGVVGLDDLRELLIYWGDAASSSAGALAADLNADGIVNTPDLDLVRANFGQTAPAANAPQPTSNPDRAGDENADGSDTTSTPSTDATEPGDIPSRDPEPTRPSKPVVPTFNPAPTTRPKPASPSLALTPDAQRAAAMRPAANALSLTRPGKSDALVADAPTRESAPPRRFNALALRGSK